MRQHASAAASDPASAEMLSTTCELDLAGGKQFDTNRRWVCGTRHMLIGIGNVYEGVQAGTIKRRARHLANSKWNLVQDAIGNLVVPRGLLLLAMHNRRIRLIY